jgi:hypothetical protein
MNVNLMVHNIQFAGDKEMITVEDKEIVRRAYYIEHHRNTIRKTLDDGMVPEYSLKELRPTPILTPVKGIIDIW